MKTITITILLFMLFACNLYSQNNIDTIFIVKKHHEAKSIIDSVFIGVNELCNQYKANQYIETPQIDLIFKNRINYECNIIFEEINSFFFAIKLHYDNCNLIIEPYTYDKLSSKYFSKVLVFNISEELMKEIKLFNTHYNDLLKDVEKNCK